MIELDPALAALAALRRGERLLGFDIGTKTIGLAMSDVERRMATPLETVFRGKFTKDAERISALVTRYSIGGFEVGLPQAVSCTLEGPRQGKPMQEWIRLGLTPVAGNPPEWSGNATAFLVMPAGRRGPAFLVSENFYVLKQYNESDLYALLIGHLADRMRGRDGPPRHVRLEPELVVRGTA